MKYVMGFCSASLVSFLIGLFMWKFLLGFLLSLIPQDVAYAWVGKLLCIVLVGWFGGVSIPLVCFILIMYAAVKMIN